MTFLSSVRRAVCAGAFLLGLSALPARAATFVVSNLKDSGDGSLRQAIARASANTEKDTITFAPTVKGTLSLASSLTINRDYGVDIQGPGSSVLTITSPTTALSFDSGGNRCSVSGLTFSSCKNHAIYVRSGVISVTYCAFSNNSAPDLSGGGGDFELWLSWGFLLLFHRQHRFSWGGDLQRCRLVLRRFKCFRWQLDLLRQSCHWPVRRR